MTPSARSFQLSPQTLLKWLAVLASMAFVAASPPAGAAGPAPDTATARYEVRFMQDMIEHHTMAVHMGHMCMAKAVHQELREMCREIIDTQQQEIGTLQQWLAAWYGVQSGEPEMNPGHHHRMHKLSMLSNAEFEIEFMQQMIRHHKGAVVKSSQCLARAYHDELQDMCSEIISAQLAEIEQMQEWLCTWYGLCRPRHHR